MVVTLDGNAQRVPVLALAQVRKRLFAVAQPEDAAANRLRIHSVDEEADVLAAFAPADVQIVTAAVVDAAVGGTGRVAETLLLRAEFLAAFRALDLAEQGIELKLEIEILLLARQHAEALARLCLGDDHTLLDLPCRGGVRRRRRSATAASSGRDGEIA